MIKIETKIARMLTENTGRHMLDSGDAYGRHWQQNQGRKFAKEPAVTLRIYKYKNDGPHSYFIDVTINVFHFLVDQLRVTKESERLERAFYKKYKDSEESYFHDVNDYLESLKIEPRKLYGENTYNGESMLSQVIQYDVFEHPDDGESYCILMVHGGADVRGGYTAPKFFSIDHADEYPLSRVCSVGLGCSHCRELQYDTMHNGYSFTDESGHAFNFPLYTESEIAEAIAAGKESHELERIIVPAEQACYLPDYKKEGEQLVINPDASLPGFGQAVKIMPDGSYTCPLCGEGRLQVYGTWEY